LNRLLAFALAVAALAPRGARAHGMRTAYLELVEGTGGSAVATARFTLLDASVRFAIDGCTLTPDGGDPRTHTFTFAVRCPSPIAGRTVRVAGLGPIVTEAVVRAALADGAVRSGVLRADVPSLTLPRAPGHPLAVLRDYLRLGLLHILTGFDHLLFLLALALQLWRVRAVLLAETAFTFSHTLSFSATALGLVKLSPAAAEACIALSLLLLARELVAGRPVTPSRGALLALAFGLVHGLGFAGGLREIGLPEHDVATALVGFGAGVEVGQVLFLVLLLLVLHARPVATRRALVAGAGGLAVGVVGAWWLWERLATLFATA
jgi:hypothetical protein